jgi:hypothetical protein
MNEKFVVNNISLHSVVTWEEKYKKVLVNERILESRKYFKIIAKHESTSFIKFLKDKAP